MRDWSLRRTLQALPGWLQRLVNVGAEPDDSAELRARKAGLVLSAVLMACLACVWVVTYAALGLWASALIPLGYQLATAVSVAVFARTKRYVLFRQSQLVLPLILPFALQWSLGGFESSSAVSLWAITSPIGALVFVGARQAVPWFVAFAGLVAASVALDPALADGAPDIPSGVRLAFFALNVLGVAVTVFAVLQYFVRARERALADLAEQHRALEAEQAKSERLLLNVLPAPIAARLKEREAVIADDLRSVSVLFADIAGFTPLAERLSASEVVTLLDRVFARWDALAAEHGVEKIKTIGDAYMAAAGIPLPREDHAEAIAALALAMGPELDACAASAGVPLQVRIGIDSGPVVAGVIGRAKFSYDLWGDTVNTASRMESHAPPGAIQVTERAHRLLRHRFALRHRGSVDIKGKGPMECYLLTGPAPAVAYDQAMPDTAPLITGVDFVMCPTQDLGRAVAFYGETLGLPRSVYMPDRGFAEFETGNVTLSVFEAEKMGLTFSPNPNALPLHVGDVAAARADLQSRGVAFLGDTFDTGVCHMAFFADPDGNALMLHHRYAPRVTEG